MIPEKIDRYEIKKEIGRGGMATVYEAYDPRFERTVAVKMLPREFMHEAEFRARFTREAKTIATLEHPAIVPVYDFGEENGQPYLVMRLMTGGSLADRLADEPLSIDETAVILKRLGSALDRAHQKGIIHRDLKPSNVLFDQYGDAFLADFGIVHVTSSTNALTASGSLVGTPTYMSPEQVYGDKQLDGRSDIYALGVILFQMLTGNTPYDADTPARMMMKHVMDPVPQILSVRPDLPPACNELINKAMAKERNDRFASATDLSLALTAATKHNLKQPNIAKLEVDLTEMKEDFLEEPATPIRATAVPLDTATAAAAAPPPPPPVNTGTGSGSLPTPTPQPQSASSSGVPKWIWGVVALVVILCVGGTWLAFTLIPDDQFSFLSGDPTNTPRPEKDEEEDPVDDQATAEAIAAIETAETDTATAEAGTATAEAIPPTNTAEPATLTPTSTKVAPTPDALATRQSIEATRAAAATDTPPPLPPSSNLATIYGPVNGTIPHNSDEFLETFYANISPENFVMRVEMIVPYSSAIGDWDFGLVFRQTDIDDEMRLIVLSDGEWNLDDRTPGTDNYVDEGDASQYLNFNVGDSNLFEMIVTGDIGYFFLNGNFVSQLDLSSRVTAGDIALGIGFYASTEVAGEVTTYNNFSLWPIAPVYGPNSGELVHVIDDLIKLEATNVDQVNFIADAIYTNPFAASVNGWDFGFSFRSNGSFKYWLIVASEGNWELADRQGSADDDETVAEGDIVNLNLGENESNRIRLIAWGNSGYLFVNDSYIATLDISDNQDSGDIEAMSAYYFDHEIEGEVTRFSDFTIIPLP
jgi:serine/threonine protein kinase